MTCTTDRRRFLKTSATLGIGYWIAAGLEAQEPRSANERIAFGCIGVGGKGGSDTADAARHGDVVALCDADANTLGAAAKKYPKAKTFRDFRKMLEQMHRSIDAVTISTPDHIHAPAALMAMRLGKHCFCQKPLARTVYEARLMGKVARENRVATQMGNQGTASSALRRAAAWLRAGVLGQVREVHVWTNRPIWPQGHDRPAGEDPVPASLDWDLWIGPAPMRPYKAFHVDTPVRVMGQIVRRITKAEKRRSAVYHPFVWRGWWDFGTGALGDMGCHEINMPFMGLDLRNPVWVEAETSGHNQDSFPAWSVVSYQFAATDRRGAVKLVWYDGGKTPSADLLEGRKPGASGLLVIGERGKLVGYNELLGGAEKKDVEFPESPGHFQEWVRAIRGGPPAMSNFPDYAGPLAEVVLLGNLAVWCGQRVQWDHENLRAKNIPGLEPLVRPEYRSGYTLDV
ncbi:MAG: Gfo/Idh/MocA family protein [Thermoguttaceae bacterium]